MPPTPPNAFWDPWDEPLSGLDLDLVLAIGRRDRTGLLRVIAQGGRPHRFDPTTWQTPVALAIECGFDEAVPVLLEHGDCPWHRDHDGLNAVDHALVQGKVHLVERLLEERDPGRWHADLPDAVLRAVQGGHVPMVAYLLERGWPLGEVRLDTLLVTLRTGLLRSTHNERDDGPFAPGAEQRQAAYPAVRALIEQRLLNESLDAPETQGAAPTAPSRRPRL